MSLALVNLHYSPVVVTRKLLASLNKNFSGSEDPGPKMVYRPVAADWWVALARQELGFNKARVPWPVGPAERISVEFIKIL